MFRSVLILTLVLLAGVAGVAASSTAPGSCGWHQVAVPNGSATYLHGMAVLGANDIWAVGGINQSATSTLHWDGATWSRVSSPNPGTGYNDLRGVAALTSDDVWAVGETSMYNGALSSLIVHWDGTAWSRVPSPNLPNSTGSILSSVRAFATNDVWAAGWATSSIGDQTLVLHWDGSSWTLSLQDGVGVPLRTIDGVASNDLWAAGLGPWALHWDGSSWSTDPLPGPMTFMLDTAAIAPNDVWMVGNYQSNHTAQIEHWDGSVWTRAANLPSGTAYLSAAAVVAPDNIWVGSAEDASRIFHWDGAAWGLLPGPFTNADVVMDMQALAADNIWAVGTTSYLPLVAHYDCNTTPTPVPPTPVPTTPPTPVTSPTPAPPTPVTSPTPAPPTPTWTPGPPVLPTLRLPYEEGQQIYWTGGPHGYQEGGNLTTTYAVGQGSGIDFAAPGGASFQVLTMAAGTVTDISNWGAGFGWHVAVRHDVGGTVMIYAHLDPARIGAHFGQHLDRGQPLAWSGRSGNQTAVHLHVELRDGRATCSIECQPPLPIPGNPIGWDTGLSLDGYVIRGYWADPEGGRAFNYDGSAVLAGLPLQTISGFPFLDGPPDHPVPKHAAAVAADSLFVCDPQAVTCEDNAQRRGQTVFASNDGTFGTAPAGVGPLPVLESTNVLVGTPIPPPPSPTPCPITYSDVPPDHPFASYIRIISCMGVVNGYPDGTFHPGAGATRGQVAKMVAGAAAYDDAIPADRQTFSDVPPSYPFWLYIERVAGRGVVNGYPDGTFRPVGEVTRGQMAKMVAGASGIADSIDADQQTFSDVLPSSPFWLYIERVAGRGVVNGYPDGTFRPGPGLTRGQAAKFLVNAFFANVSVP